MKYTLAFMTIFFTAIFSFIIFSNLQGSKIQALQNRTMQFSLEDVLIKYPQYDPRKFIIDEVNLSSPGFVLIYKEQNDVVGQLIATSTILPPGNTQNLIIESDDLLQRDTHYFAALHHDNGNKTFDSPIVDAPVVINNEILRKRFFIK